MPYLELDGLKFHYQQTGQGPDVVLVHAFTSNLAVWLLTNVVDTLANDFRVTVYDLRGHGKSDVTPSGYTSAHMADDLQRLLMALGIERAYLVGHSYGGVIAMHAAQQWPDRVTGVVLSDSYFPGLAHIEPNVEQAGPWLDLRRDLARVGAEIGDTVDFDRLFQTVAEMPREQLQAYKQQLGPPAARWLSQLSQLEGTTAGSEMFEVAGLSADRIASVQQPVAALYDEHSPFLATCGWLQGNLPHCEVAIIPGAKHVAPLQNSAAFVGFVQQHLRAMASC